MNRLPRLPLVLFPLAAVAVWAALFAAAQSGRDPPNYSRIVDGLYVGGFVPDPPAHTTAVLNLCETEDPYRAAILKWEPIADAPPAPTLDWLRTMVAWVAENRAAGRTTFVHCRNGVSRSGMVVVAYLMWANGWERDKALEYIRVKRPDVRPHPVFMALLADWERDLRGGR